MHAIFGWKAKRSGKSITITGKDFATGKETKLSGIKLIQPEDDGTIVAHDDSGNIFRLAVTPA